MLPIIVFLNFKNSSLELFPVYVDVAELTDLYTSGPSSMIV